MTGPGRDAQSPTGPSPAAAAGRLDAMLRSIRQGDVLSFGAVAIVGTHSSQVLAAAGDTLAGDPDQQARVASVTIESASGWYAVLSQDCDIVRSVDIEPCLTVAPVVFIDDQDWGKLAAGQTSYRLFALPGDRISPLPPADADLAQGRSPAVDLRYVTSLDKTALLTVADFDRRTPLGPHARRAFGEWVGQRYNRIPFEDRVVEDVLPAIRPVLDATFRQRAKAPAGNRKAAAAFVGVVNAWYVRQAERLVEVMGRLDPAKARAEKLLTTGRGGEPVLNTKALNDGARALRKAMVAKLDANAGYALQVTWRDFEDMSAAEFETYSSWVVQDDPEASAKADD